MRPSGSWFRLRRSQPACHQILAGTAQRRGLATATRLGHCFGEIAEQDGHQQDRGHRQAEAQRRVAGQGDAADDGESVDLGGRRIIKKPLSLSYWVMELAF